MTKEKAPPLKTPEKRRKIYAYTLLGCITAIAGIGLLNIWGVGPEATAFYKIMTSLVIGAVLSAFLYTLNFGNDKQLSQNLIYVVGGAASLLSIIVVLQIWTSFMEGIFFGQTVSTLIILGLLAAFVLALFDDFFENKKMKDENYLD